MTINRQPDNMGFGKPIPLPDISLDLEASRTELQRLMTLAKVQHFTSKEFGKHHRRDWVGPSEILPVDVAIMLPVIVLADLIRTRLSKKINIGSSFRVADYNVKEGQSPRSKHLWATALDLSSPAGVPVLTKAIEQLVNPEFLPITRCQIIERVRMAGIEIVDEEDLRIGWGVYQSFVHVDVTQNGQAFARPRTLRYQ